MSHLLVCVLLGVGPADELRAALNDVQICVPPHERHGVRYASFYALPAERREEAAAVLSFVLNTVSRASVIVDLEETPGTEQRLWRVRWERYGHTADDWERIVSEDPYWHQRLSLQSAQRAAKEVFIDGPWLSADVVAALRAETGSAGAILRGDFLIERMSTTLDNGHYYRLAGIPEREDRFFVDLGVDARKIGKLGADAGANLIYSRVTRKVRRIVRRPGPLGGAWHTYDVERSTAERDPLRNPFEFAFDAGEHIATGPNGLHRFALYDAQGQRQDSVPDRIAKDTSDAHGAGIIAPMISCVRCHVEDGLRPFANDQQRLLAGNVDLLTARPRAAERLADFYGGDLDRWLQRDREDYANAVSRAAQGIAVRDVATALGRIYSEYVDDLVTPEQAARELGVELKVMIEAARSSHDPALLALIEGISIQREQWIAAFAEAATLTARTTRAPTALNEK